MNAIHARSQLRYWPTWLGLLGQLTLDRNALSRQRQTLRAIRLDAPGGRDYPLRPRCGATRRPLVFRSLAADS